jgi:hypothetical protein
LLEQITVAALDCGLPAVLVCVPFLFVLVRVQVRLWPSTRRQHSSAGTLVLLELELELELIQIHMALKPMLRAEVYARALGESQNVKRAEVWVGAQ